MAQRPEELRQEIADTRADMSGTLDAIGDRVSPGRVAERRWARVRGGAGRARDKVMGSPSSGGSDDGGRLSGTAGSVSDAASSGTEKVSGAVRNAPDTVQQGTQGNPLVAGALAFGVGALIGSLLPPSQEEQELAGGLVEPLKQDATAAAKQVGDATKGAAQQAAGEAKESAQQAADSVKQHATDSAQQVKGEAQGAAQDVKGSAQDKADDVKR